MTLPWILILIICIGTAAALIEIFFYMKRKRSVEYLQADYKKAYMKVTACIGSSGLSIIEQRDISLDIASMLFDAQNKNRPVSEVIGIDTAGFVETVIHSLGYRNPWPFIIIEGLRYTLLSLLVAQFAVFLMRPADTLYEATLGYPIIIYLVILSFILLPMIRNYIQKKRNILMLIIPVILIILFVLFYIFSDRIFGSASAINSFLDGEISLMPNSAIFITVLLLFLSTFVIKHFYRFFITRKMRT